MTDGIGIRAVSAYVPERRVELRPRMTEFGINEDFLTKKTGYFRLARKAEAQETSRLAQLAVQPLFDARPGLREELDALVVVTQNPDGYGLPHTAAILHGKLGLPTSVAAFDISLGCSGWVYGMSVLKSFLEANGMRHGVLVTADPYSKVLDDGDKNTALLFGDAATATLLGPTDVQWRIGKFVFGTDGTKWADLRVDENRKLRMNGMGVFTFSATKVPPCIKDTVAHNDLTLDAIDRVLLHQGSRYIVDTIGARLGMADKTPFSENGIGNTVSSTLPMLLAEGVAAGARRVVVCGFGVGLSWAATVLTNTGTLEIG
jgi:3-oxoacyl-[acyl-carrier-protein] synthase-3